MHSIATEPYLPLLTKCSKSTSVNCAVTHYTKALIICNLLDRKVEDKEVELKVAMLKQIEMASLAGDYMNMTSSAQLKVSYELAIEKKRGECGDDNPSRSGLFIAP